MQFKEDRYAVGDFNQIPDGVVSIPQAVSTIAMVDAEDKKGREVATVSIPQAVSTIAIWQEQRSYR